MQQSMIGVESISLSINAPLKLFIMFFIGIFKSIVDMIVIPALDYYSDIEQSIKREKHISKEENENAEDEENEDVTPCLFPRRHNVNMSLFESASVIPCSLDISTVDSAMTMSTTPEGQLQCKLNTDDNSILPSNNKYNMMVTPPTSVGANGLPISPESNTSCTPIKSEEEGVPSASTATTSTANLNPDAMKSEVPEGANNEGLFVCHYCDAKFKIRGYLTRHIKKHAIQKAYHCPFFMGDAPPELRCHNSGGFSRRDTYKTHLRTRHFIYPKGVKPSERNKSAGNCGQCGQNFENTDKWVEQHIESGECTGLPHDYVRNIKSERKSGKLKMIKTSTGHSRFISTAQSVVEPKVLLNKEALEAMAIVAHNTNRSDILSRYGNNKILMISANFKGESKPKKKYSRKRGSQLNNSKKSDKNLPAQQLQPVSSLSSTETPTALPPLEESPVVFNSYNFDANTPYIDSSIIPSPEQNHSLEPVPSTSSASSHECHMNTKYNGYNSSVNEVSNNNVMFNDPFSVPLDTEQSPSYGPPDYNVVKSHPHGTPGEDMQQIAINETLQRQMDPVVLGDSQLREVKQYANFYKHTFGYKV
ncbi:hypothetical protein ZYGR_0AK06000 [Zygosaccharomyces rouxii]|uniref:Transcription factor STP1 n=1 Tax=Zygosaccharomyces rouxii TaxID=4956 RepID=A0A1Q3AEH8_ZYGRO|nr:hypothetical protein ZYGR_0AK06000 [Zygosaccharomyces rouxii]